VFLSNKFVQGAGAHAGRQRRFFFYLLIAGVVKKAHNGILS
jgi:hypothetical protein